MTNLKSYLLAKFKKQNPYPIKAMESVTVANSFVLRHERQIATLEARVANLEAALAKMERP